MSVDPVASSRCQDAPATTRSSQQRQDGLGEFSPTWYGFLWPVWIPGPCVPGAEPTRMFPKLFQAGSKHGLIS